MKWVRDIVTEPGSDRICVIRVIALIGFAQFFALASWQFHKHGIFDPQTYALGFGAMITGAGVALGLKKDTQPPPPPPAQIP